MYQGLVDKSLCSVCRFRVKFKLDLSFSEMRKPYSIRLKKHKHKNRESIKISWEEFMKGTINLNCVVQVIILCEFNEEGKQS